MGMVNRFKTVGVMSTVFVAALSASANAAVLTGGFSITGFFNPYTCTASGCVSAGLAGSTAVDVTTMSGTNTPGVAGPITSGDASGTLGALIPNGTTGSLKDFSFSGPGSADFPLAPITSFELFPAVTFNLASISGTVSASFLNLTGTGTFVCTGGTAVCDPTPGSFIYTGQTANNTTFSFSASQAANAAPIPEPGSMMLFGSGLLGLATAARRRFSGK